MNVVAKSQSRVVLCPEYWCIYIMAQRHWFRFMQLTKKFSQAIAVLPFIFVRLDTVEVSKKNV